MVSDVGAVLSDVALTAEQATGKRKGEIVFLAVIKVMAASAAYTSIEQSDAGIDGGGHIKIVTIAVCPCCIGHADRMV